MKKIISLMLMVILVLAMAIPVFADEADTGVVADYEYDPVTGRITGMYMTEEAYKTEKPLVNTYLDVADGDHLVGSNKISVNVEEGEHQVLVYANGKLVGTYKVVAEAAKVEPIIRVAGQDRYGTAFAACDELKAKLKVSQFDTVVIACGTNFADALSGTYLAGIKNAPILLVNPATEAKVIETVNKDLKKGGTVYLLGGELVVSKNVETALAAKGFSVKRLAGKDRYGTNLAILKEAGVKSGEILVCSGASYADSLSASSVGKPIFLVGKELTADQVNYLGTLGTTKFDIVGGNFAVVPKVESDLKKYGETERVAGQTRFDTSVEVAKKFFPGNRGTAVLAYAMDFPDGLSGGSLGVAYKAPILLVTNTNYKAAAAYTKAAGVKTVIIMGGTLRISDDTAKACLA